MDNKKESKPIPKEGKSAIRHTIAQKIDAALTDIKKQFDPRKYDKRLKKASKLLSEILVKNGTAAPVKLPKAAAPKKVAAKKSPKKAAKKPASKKAVKAASPAV